MRGFVALLVGMGIVLGQRVWVVDLEENWERCRAELVFRFCEIGVCDLYLGVLLLLVDGKSGTDILNVPC